MPAFTGVGFIDWLIFVAATLTALTVIYRKGLLPIVRFFKGVSTALDHIEQVPEIAASIVKVNERIDSHMETEEASLKSVGDSIGAIEASLDQRTHLFVELKESLEGHMAEDRKQFAAAAEALGVGQIALDKRLEGIQNTLNAD